MKIRAQIVLAFLLLAVLPLTALILYSYHSSCTAAREAVEAEAGELTREMEGRMAEVQEDLRRRVGRVGRHPMARKMSSGGAESDLEMKAFEMKMLEELGEAAPLVRSVQFLPRAAPGAGRPSGPPGSVAPPRPGESQMMIIDVPAVMKEVEKSLRDLEIEEGEHASRAVLMGMRAAAELAARLDANAPHSPPGFPDVPPQDPPARGLRSDPGRRSDSGEAVAEGKDVFGFEFETELMVPVEERGEVVGELKTRISGSRLLAEVLARTRRNQGEIPFAIDREGRRYTVDEADRKAIGHLPLGDGETQLIEARGEESVADNWVVVVSEEEKTGLTFGIARPIRESLDEIRRTAGRNLGWGLGVIALALVGILPLTARMTKNLELVTQGAKRISQGDLGTRVDVTSKSEIGQLARAFNGMAGDLERNRQLLVEEEEHRRHQEVERQLLQAEVERKTDELEEARRFQLSMLPASLPEHPTFELSVEMETATEVGGDYYDFRETDSGELIIAVGDATGHGAKAGTMVTVIKSLFSAFPPTASLSSFLGDANRAIRRMKLGRMAMALILAKLDGRTLTLSAAGMPPAYLFRRSTSKVEELSLEGMPLGGLTRRYSERSVQVSPGDTLLLMSDGFPELLDPDGEPFGYERAQEAFEAVAGSSPEKIIAALTRTAKGWSGGASPSDDLTFVAVRIRVPPAATTSS